MYHDRPTFSLVKWSDEDVNEYRGGLETIEGIHAVSLLSSFEPFFACCAQTHLRLYLHRLPDLDWASENEAFGIRTPISHRSLGVVVLVDPNVRR